MTQEQFEILKTEYIDNIKKFIIENGGLFPHLSIFAEQKETDTLKSLFKKSSETKHTLIHVPIPDELMVDEEGKEKFVNELFPVIAKDVKENYKAKAIAWAAEAWVRVIDKDQKVENWKDHPIKKEVVIITIESMDDQECVIYDIIRNGKQITSDGDMVDKISLVEDTETMKIKGFGGRFSGLINYLKD